MKYLAFIVHLISICKVLHFLFLCFQSFDSWTQSFPLKIYFHPQFHHISKVFQNASHSKFFIPLLNYQSTPLILTLFLQFAQLWPWNYLVFTKLLNLSFLFPIPLLLNHVSNAFHLLKTLLRIQLSSLEFLSSKISVNFLLLYSLI